MRADAAARQLTFSVTGTEPGRAYAFQESGDLLVWAETGRLVSADAEFTLPAPDSGPRYYRLTVP